MSNVWILQVNDYDSEEIVAVWDHKPSIKEIKEVVIPLSKPFVVDYLPDILKVEMRKLYKGLYSVEVEGSELYCIEFSLEKFEVIKGGGK